MNANKIFGILLVGILSASMLFSCSDETSAKSGEKASDGHVHTVTSNTWECNAVEHWQLCGECSIPLDKASHDIKSGVRCSICNSDIWDVGDGTYEIYCYSVYGDLIRTASYDDKGNIVDEFRNVVEYDENGNLLSAKAYYNDILFDITEYGMDAEGNVYEAKYTYYNEDRSCCVSEYNEYGDLLLMADYDTDGNKLYEEISEYAEDSDGDRYEAKTTTIDYEAGTSYIGEYNEHGDQIAVITADLEGNILKERRIEYGYGENSERIWKKVYVNGFLAEEVPAYISIQTNEYSMRVPEREIYYEENGAKMIAVPNDIGDVGTETYYNADGEVALTVTYEYDFFSNGERSNLRTYEDGVLVQEIKYQIDAVYGWSYQEKIIEYGENGEVLSERTFDANGNEITG